MSALLIAWLISLPRCCSIELALTPAGRVPDHEMPPPL